MHTSSPPPVIARPLLPVMHAERHDHRHAVPVLPAHTGQIVPRTLILLDPNNSLKGVGDLTLY